MRRLGWVEFAVITAVLGGAADAQCLAPGCPPGRPPSFSGAYAPPQQFQQQPQWQQQRQFQQQLQSQQQLQYQQQQQLLLQQQVYQQRQMLQSGEQPQPPQALACRTPSMTCGAMAPGNCACTDQYGNSEYGDAE